MAKRDETGMTADDGRRSDSGGTPDAAATLAGLATQIQAGHRTCLEALKGVVGQAKAIGEALIEAKKLVGHGRWLAWIEANCRFAVRMAQNYMLVATHHDAVVARFDAADGWRLTEFIAVARELEAARRRTARGDAPAAAKPDPFAGGPEECVRRHQRFQTREVRKAAGRVEADPAVEEFVRTQLATLYAAVRRFAASKKAAALAGETLDAADLGIIVIGQVRQSLGSDELFTPASAPAVPADPSAHRPVNRLEGHIGNGKADGHLTV